MSQPLRAGLPASLDLGPGYVFQFTALNPTTGALVANVNVSGATLTVHNVAGAPLAELLEPTTIEWLNLPVAESG